MSDQEACLIYTTCPDTETAEKIAAALVEGRLAACANIYPGMVSVYEWKGEMCRDAEVGVILKTRRSLEAAARAALKAAHPYETPALIVLAADGVDEDYLAWLKAQTQG